MNIANAKPMRVSSKHGRWTCERQTCEKWSQYVYPKRRNKVYYTAYIQTVRLGKEMP
jgi:hypothetical protein